MHFIVYQTTNLINGKVYIGYHRTANLNDEYLGSGVYLAKAIKKYGKQNFKRDILYVFDNENAARDAERSIVNEEFVARRDTYNLNIGGFGSSYYNVSTGKCHSNEANAKRAKSMRDKWANDDTRRIKLSTMMKKNNPMHNPVNIAKMRQNSIGKHGLKGKTGSEHPTYKLVSCIIVNSGENIKLTESEHRARNDVVTPGQTSKYIVNGNVFYNARLAIEYINSTFNVVGTPGVEFWSNNRANIIANKKIIKKGYFKEYAGKTWSDIGIQIHSLTNTERYGAN